jgi:hypothetical protein
VSGSHNVILSAQPCVQLDILKGPGNTEFSQLVRAHPGNSLPIAGNLAFLGFVEAVYAVEEGGLASTIRPNDRQDLVIPDIHTHVVKCSDTAKVKREVVNPQSNLLISFHL